mmetsp:Transcript_16568/g.23364  ORF Transcript_16568/g.23364 Transcript_16568/m.23364 type:complete len:279 (+) Transcript_16568:86-922(+)
MKLNLAVLCAVIASTSARRDVNPVQRAKQLRVLLKVRDGTFLDGVDSLDPSVDWGRSSKVGGVNIDYGVEAAVSIKEDAPRKVWAKGTTTQAGWGLSLRAEMDANERSNADIELDALNEDIDLQFAIDASVGKEGGLNLKQVEASYQAETEILSQEGMVSLAPRWDFASNTQDVALGYESGKTKLSLTASLDKQDLKVKRDLPYDSRVSVQASTKDKVQVEYERDLDGGGLLALNYSPDDKINVKWADGNGWEAKASVDVDGTGFHDANVHIGTQLEF